MLTFSQAMTDTQMMLLTACALFALAVLCIVYVLGVKATQHEDVMTGAVGAARRRVLREPGRQQSELFAFVLSLVEVIEPIVRALPTDWIRSSVVPRYEAAGWPGGLSDDELVSLTAIISVVISLVFMLILGLIFGPMIGLFGLIGVALGPILVGNDLKSRAEHRDLQINRTMPFVLDLLVLTMRSGASLPIALQRVALDYKDHPIGEEFQTTLREIDLGTTRREAFETMADRVGLPVVRQFVDDVIQAEELGRPLADTLARLCERMRERRLQDAQDTAGKAKVKVLLPGMLVFLSVLILLFAPFLLRFIYSEGGGL